MKNQQAKGETTMASKKVGSKGTAAKKNAKATVVETPVVEVVAAPIETKDKRARKSTADLPDSAPAPDTAKATEAVNAATDDSEETVVFALRLSRRERDALHAAAGPAKASQFVRRLIIAASTGDTASLLSLGTEARTNRA